MRRKDRLSIITPRKAGCEPWSHLIEDHHNGQLSSHVTDSYFPGAFLEKPSTSGCTEADSQASPACFLSSPTSHFFRARLYSETVCSFWKCKPQHSRAGQRQAQRQGQILAPFKLCGWEYFIAPLIWISFSLKTTMECWEGNEWVQGVRTALTQSLNVGWVIPVTEMWVFTPFWLMTTSLPVKAQLCLNFFPKSDCWSFPNLLPPAFTTCST